MCPILMMSMTVLMTDPEWRGELEGAHYGRITVIGNRYTQSRYVKAFVPIETGAKMKYGNVKAGRDALRSTLIFDIDPNTRQFPSVEIDTNSSNQQYLDVVIRIIDKPENDLSFSIIDAYRSGILYLLFQNEEDNQQCKVSVSRIIRCLLPLNNQL